jgi:phosphoserine phosphatase RsbU/P
MDRPRTPRQSRYFSDLTDDENVVRGDLVHPLLMRLGVRSMLGVPFANGEVLMGVLHIGTFTPRRYTDHEVEFLQQSADRSAVALQTLIARSEHQAAGELQRSLLPSTLPVYAGAELAARYRAGTADLGGDWYDAFIRPSGELCLVMGDVAGHGLHRPPSWDVCAAHCVRTRCRPGTSRMC